MDEPTITPDLCKAARALARLTQRELSAKAKIGDQTLADFERGARDPLPETLAKIRATLERAGVVFISENGGGAGVRLRKA